MIWFTWRQHRIEFIILAVVLILFSALVVNAAIDVRIYSADQPIMAEQIAKSYPLLMVNVLPAMMGVFIAAPMLSKQIENGTLQLIFTQSISRKRWFWGEFGTVGLIVIGLFVVFAICQGYFAHYASALTNPWDWFDIKGPVYLAYAVLALCVGALLGLIIGKQVPSMVASLGLFSGLRLALILTRSHWFKPLTSRWNFVGINPTIQNTQGSWITSTRLLDSFGKRLVDDTGLIRCQMQLGNGNTLQDVTCQYQAGMMLEYSYQPIERFQQIQIIEVVVVLLLCVLSVGLMQWIIEKRKH